MAKKKSKKAIKIPVDKPPEITDADNPTILHQGEFWYLWCCDCHLRHVYVVDIVRGETPKDDYVRMFLNRDNWATDTRRAK